LNTYAISETGLNWLELILTERFGNEWILRRVSKTLILSLKGAEGYIIFDQLEECFTHPRSDLDFCLWDAESDGWQSILGGSMPAPGVRELIAPLISKEQKAGYVIHYDILGLIYWMLARIEEVDRSDLDAHGRFPATSSHAYRFDYLERPVIDEWLHVLGQVIERQWPTIELKRHNFKLMISHDVDHPSRYCFGSLAKFARRMAGDLLRRRDLHSFLMAPFIRLRSKTKLHPSDPYHTFDWIMDQSEQHGLTSTFYFICGRTNPRFDADYDIGNPVLRNLLCQIHARGHEIGLHPSYNTYRHPAALKAEADRLRRVCRDEEIYQAKWGGRMHYLRWEQPTTLRVLEAAGISYDSTLGYADHAGFRCGTCFDYPAFDPVASRILRLRIRPLVAMEQSVLSATYMGLDIEKAASAKFLELRETCRKVGGNFTLLWHNSELSQRNERELYRSILGL